MDLAYEKCAHVDFKKNNFINRTLKQISRIIVFIS